jgi:ribosome biogenesis GTPase
MFSLPTTPSGVPIPSTLTQAGWDPVWQGLLAQLADPTLLPARVLREDRTVWQVLTAQGAVSAEATGQLLHGMLDRHDRPATGDWLAIAMPERSPHARIHAILPRRSCLVRRAAGTSGDDQLIAANVDTVFVVCGLDGDYNLRRIERYLALVRDGGATPVVVLNKRDTCTEAERRQAEVAAITVGAPVLLTSAATGDGLDALRRHLRPGATAALLGSSGAGKSSLANRLLAEARQVTGAVRDDDSRGRHTTTARELLPLPGGGVLLDTPGMRELQLAVDEASLDVSFDDIARLAASCRFNDCSHTGEPGCAVVAAVQDGTLAAGRLAGFRKLKREHESDRQRHGGGGRAEERARQRRFGRMVREVVRRKRQMRGEA